MVFSRTIKQIMQASLLVAAAALSGCGGDTAATTNNSGATSVSLTGVVVSGTSAAGGVATRAVAAPGSNITGVYPQAIVIAVDKDGNTKTTSADKVGAFSIALDSGTSYGVVFLDGKSLNVLGSLVQASNTAQAGAVEVTANADLGNIVIDPASGKAVSENDASGTLQGVSLVQAPAALDANGDGKVGKSEISAVQAASAANGNVLQSISLIFPANRWSVDGDLYEIRVISSEQGIGPDGTIVDIHQDSGLQYYTAGPNGGLTFTAPPAQYDPAIQTFSFKSTDDYVKQEKWGLQDGTWSKQYPLSFDLGVTTPLFENAQASITVNFSLAQENGANAIFTDVSGAKHVILAYRIQGTFTPDPATCGTQCAVQVIDDKAYMIPAYSVFAGATDAAGNAITPSQSLANFTFGTITTDAAGKFASATNENSLNAATPLITVAQRDALLAYLWNNSAAIDAAQDAKNVSKAGGAVATGYFLMNTDVYGEVVSPAAINSTTYLYTPLLAGSLQTFTSNVDYINAAASTLNYELRAGTTVLASSVAVNAANSNGVLTNLAISGDINLPTVATLPTAYQYDSMDYATGNPIKVGNVGLWLVMKDAGGTLESEHLVEVYTIQ